MQEIESSKKVNILCCGGGTLGPVIPLLAVIRVMQRQQPAITVAWAGTPEGPERHVIEREGWPFYPIPVAKFPRYPSLDWVTWPWNYLAAQRAAHEAVSKTHPDLVIAAGGFTSVPIIRDAARRGIPCVIHQLDAVPGLSNQAVAAQCQMVTTSFSYEVSPFKGVTCKQVPTPCRFAGLPIPSRATAAASFELDSRQPVVLFLGGGTGAIALNEIVWSLLEKLLPMTQVIHQTGAGKRGAHVSRARYLVQEFFDESQMKNAYACADIVVARAGLGTLSELACLSKPSILIPIPHSHQEENARRVPVPSVAQGKDSGSKLLYELTDLLNHPERAVRIGEDLHRVLPTDDGSSLAKRWLTLAK